MKIATIIVRVFMGLVFVVFGVIFLLKLMPMPPPPKGPGGDFSTILINSGYMNVIKCFEICGGLLLLIGKKVPLGLTLVGPVIVNILLYGILLDHTALAPGIIFGVLSLFLLWRYRTAFAGLLTQ